MSAHKADTKEPSRREIARACGCDEGAIRKWEKLPDSPKTRDIEAWKAYVAAHHLTRPQSVKGYAEMRTEKLAVETRLLKLKEAKEKRELIPFADAQAAFDRLLAKWHQLIAQKLEVETPARLVGKDITAARVEAKRIHDEIAETVNAQFGESTRELKP